VNLFLKHSANKHLRPLLLSFTGKRSILITALCVGTASEVHS